MSDRGIFAVANAARLARGEIECVTEPSMLPALSAQRWRTVMGALEHRVERARLNVKRATRRERPKAKRRLERLQIKLAVHHFVVLYDCARDVGIEPLPDETFRELRGRVLLKLEFMPMSGAKRELRRMLRR